MGWISSGIKIGHYFNPKLALNLSVYGAFWSIYGGHAPTISAGLSYEW